MIRDKRDFPNLRPLSGWSRAADKTITVNEISDGNHHARNRVGLVTDWGKVRSN